MTFRSRILLACMVAALTPLTLLVFGARREVRARLTAQFEQRAVAAGELIQSDLARHANALDRQLAALASRIADDAGLRAALLQPIDRAPVLDYASGIATAAGLDYLLLLADDGTILSSGHYRNDYDRPVAALRAVLAAEQPVLVAGRTPQRALLALVRAHHFNVGPRRFVLAGGIEVDSAFVRTLARADEDVVVSLVHPSGEVASGALPRTGYAREIVLPWIDDADGGAQPAEAIWRVSHSLLPLDRILAAVDRWFLGAAALAVLLAFITARLLAARVTQPLEELARKSTRVHLDRGPVGLAMRRPDEIGTLSRMLDSMVQRLRASATELRAAERRATVGDMARQVNHDIRNGLLPLRNVLQHLTEVAHAEPAQLGSVFVEREGTLNSGVAYLESLATSYGRIAPRAERQLCAVNDIVRDMLPADDARVRLELSADVPRVSADPVALRRVLENLTVNALQSLDTGDGTVTIRTGAEDGRVVVSVTDTGTGIEPDAVERIFEDFYTTRASGTGLGLSIVRRLVTDMGGRIRVDSEPGRGSTFRIELPEAT